MYRQIFTFVVLATVIQNSTGTYSHNTIKIDDGGASDSCAIQVDQETAIFEFRKGTSIVFNAIRGQISKVIDKNKTTSNYGTSSTTLSREESYAAYERGIYIIFDAVDRLTSYKNSLADTTARQCFRKALRIGVDYIFKAVGLISDREYWKNQSNIKESEKVTVPEATPVTECIFIKTRNGQKRPDEMECMIDRYEKKAIHKDMLALRKIYSGIEIAANMSCGSETESENSIIAIDKAQNETNSAFDSYIEIVFKLIRILYLDSYRNKMDMYYIFATLESSRERAMEKTLQGIKIIFGVIKPIVVNAMDGKDDQSKDELCASEIAENETYETWLDAVNYLLESNSLVQIISFSMRSTSQYMSRQALREGVTGLFEVIRSAQNNLAEYNSELERRQNRTLAADLTIEAGRYLATLNGRKEPDVMAKLVHDARERTIPYVVNGIRSIFDGIQFLAEVKAGKHDNHRNHSSTLDNASNNTYLEFKKDIDIYYDLLKFFVATSFVKQDEIVSVFTSIQSAKEIAISEFCKGIGFIFTKMKIDMKNIISKNNNGESKPYSNQRPNNPSSSNSYKNQTTVAMSNAITATFNILKIIHLANSSVMEFFLTSSHMLLIDAIDDIYESVDAAGDECSEINAELSDSEISSTNEAIPIFRPMFPALQQEKNSAENEAAIEQADRKSTGHVSAAWSAIHNGIKIFKTKSLSVTKSDEEDIFAAMKIAENEACSAMESSLRVIFTMFQILVISSHTKPDRMSDGFSAIRSAREESAVKCRKAIEIIFESMTNDMINTTSENQSKNQQFTEFLTPENSCSKSTKFSPNANLLYEALRAGANAYYDVIQKIMPQTTAAVKTARRGHFLAMKQLVEDIFFIIDSIQHKYFSVILAEIDVMEKAATCAVTALMHNIYIPIEYGVKPDTELYAEIKEEKEETINVTVKSFIAVFKGLRMSVHNVSSAADHETRDDSCSMNDVKKESLSEMTSAVTMLYDTLLHTFVNQNIMSDTSCPST